MLNLIVLIGQDACYLLDAFCQFVEGTEILFSLDVRIQDIAFWKYLSIVVIGVEYLTTWLYFAV